MLAQVLKDFAPMQVPSQLDVKVKGRPSYFHWYGSNIEDPPCPPSQNTSSSRLAWAAGISAAVTFPPYPAELYTGEPGLF